MRPSNSDDGCFRCAGPLAALLGVGLMLAGCVPGGRTVEPSGTSPGGAPAVAPRVLRVGMISRQEPKDFLPFSTAAVQGREYEYAFHSGLTVYDAQDKLLPRVAQKVPTLETGDWKVFPDGQMEVTWKLRPNVKWHDGVAATAEDFAFGLQVFQDREFPQVRGDAATLISEVATPDASTLVVRWKETYVYANVSAPREIAALPRHLLGDLHERGDKQAFFNSPLFTNQFVGLGPYRLGEWVGASYLEGLAFGDYFLGRPKIDRVVFQFAGDANALLLSLLAGAFDMTAYGNFEMPLIIDLKKQWDPAVAGTTFHNYGGTRAYSFQFRNADAPWMDVRVRRALAHMLDRQALVDSVQGGVVSVADTVVSPTDPIYRLLEQRGLTRQPFDLTRAERLMAEAGWVRASGGVYRSASGQPFTIDITASDVPTNVTEATAVAGQWKAAGVADATFTPIPNNAPSAVQNEMRHTFTGTQGISAKDDLKSLPFTTAMIGTAENRYNGRNRGGYSDPQFDRLYAQASVTLDLAPREGLMADFLKLIADDVAMIHAFYEADVATAATRKGIRGPAPAGSSKQLLTTWNIHEWEMD